MAGIIFGNGSYLMYIVSILLAADVPTLDGYAEGAGLSSVMGKLVVTVVACIVMGTLPFGQV